MIPTFVSECQECENCLSGKSNLCLKYPLTFNGLMLDGTSRMSTVKGQKMLYHLFSCSTWSEYMVVNVNYIVKLHNWDAAAVPPLAHASFLSCGFSTGFGAPWKEAKIERGSIVAVIGLGAVGLGVSTTYSQVSTYLACNTTLYKPMSVIYIYLSMYWCCAQAVEGARMQGAARIIGIDNNDMKREKGIAFGMTDFINPDDHHSGHKSVSQLIKDSTDGMGVDYCFECTGVAHFINESLEATKMVYTPQNLYISSPSVHIQQNNGLVRTCLLSSD